jgi:hypothetical protein
MVLIIEAMGRVSWGLNMAGEIQERLLIVAKACVRLAW